MGNNGDKSGMISLESAQFGNYLIVDNDTGKDILIQTDWDYPGIASTFGWSPCDECVLSCEGGTDGTVDCKARNASEMISEAASYLDDHIGDSVEDPGYFC